MGLFVDIKKKAGDFTLQVKFETDREVFGLLGASGCGKSLTLRCIAGVETPDEGIIRLDDMVLFDSTRKINVPIRKRRIGYLFQDYALFPNMTVFQNILCGAGDKERAEEYLRKFYLEEQRNLYPSKLSGGQKQRTALARMLAANPRVVMMDEPFSALDSYLKMQLEREIMSFIEAFDGSVIFVSHDRNEVYRLTDTIGVMENGRLAGIQPKQELFRTPKTLAAARMMGCQNMTRLGNWLPGGYEALDWGILLSPNGETDKQGTEKFRYAGLDGAHFELVPAMEACNVVEGQVERIIEEVAFYTVLIRGRKQDGGGEGALLTYEVMKKDWDRLSGKLKQGSPVCLRLPEKKVMFLKD